MQHAFLETIRQASLPGIWSQGVRLARAGAVYVVSKSEAEITLRVQIAGKPVAPTVTLYFDDDEWTCDCGGKIDPCAHVTAAAIATTQGNSTGAEQAHAHAPQGPTETDASPGSTEADAPQKHAGGGPRIRVVYRLALDGRRLILSRFLVHQDGREARVTRSLLSDMGRGKLPRGLVTTHGDLEVDRLLGSPPRPALRPAVVAEVFEALAADAEVTFDGASATISSERIGPRAVVEDAPGGGFVLTVDRDPRVDAVVAQGVVRVGATLHPIAEGETTGYLLERLPLSRTFSGSDEAELVTHVLPELDRRMRLIVRTGRLPKTTTEVRPRIELDLSHHGHTLSVKPVLVYGDPAIATIEGDAVVALGDHVPVRKPAEERKLLRRLRDELHLVPGRRVDLDGTEAIRFAEKLRNWQKRNARTAEPLKSRVLSARIELVDGKFDVVFECDTAEGDTDRAPRAESATVLRAYRDGLSLVPLDTGGWAELPTDWLERYGSRVLDLLAARADDKSLPTAALPELSALCEALDAPKPPELDRLRPLFDEFEGIPSAPLPDDLTATLRRYQRVGVDWLAFTKGAGLGAVLADDMGLGKTLQTLCVLEGRTLIVCPKSVVYNWAAEIARFRPNLEVATYHGPGRELVRGADVTLTTYAVLRLDAEHLCEIDWSTVVLDEAQAIKNADSQTARAAFDLKGAFRIALSGTPVENRLDELWSIMHFANPGLLGGRSHFQERYAGPIAAGAADAAERLRKKIRPFVLRRMKAEVLPELPPRTDSVLHVELDETERSVYDAIRIATRREVVERLSEGGSIFAALEALLRLRQASCHADLVPGQHASTSSKIQCLLEALEDVVADGHKALVFSQWTSLLDRVEPHLMQAGIEFTRLDGSTRDRGAVVARFQENADCHVFLASLKAGGTGLNLTAADHVFLLDPWWNPAVEDQAADRAHRIGQERPVMVYRLVAKDTVEERILALQDKKRSLSDVALGAANHGGGITRDDLLALLE